LRLYLLPSAGLVTLVQTSASVFRCHNHSDAL